MGTLGWGVSTHSPAPVVWVDLRGRTSVKSKWALSCLCQGGLCRTSGMQACLGVNASQKRYESLPGSVLYLHCI